MGAKDKFVSYQVQAVNTAKGVWEWRQRKQGVRLGDGSVISFPYLSHPRAGLSHAEWRALGPGEKLEPLFGMSLDDLCEIMSWEPIAELDPFRLSVRVQVTRVVFTICLKGFLDGRLGREAARERLLAEMVRREFGVGDAE